MTTITYLDDFGDTITEYPPVHSGGDVVAVAYNPTGHRLIPPGCWQVPCAQPATFHVVRYHQVGKSQWYGCEHHLADDIRRAIHNLDPGRP